MPHLRIAYVLLEFPRLTETFVIDEIRAVRARGVDVHIISLLRPRHEAVSSESRELTVDTWYAPDMWGLQLWFQQARFLFNSPRLYVHLLRTLLSQPSPADRMGLFARRLVIFLKAVGVAGYLRDKDVDLLHAHFAWLSGAAAWISARLLDRPFTVTVHAFDLYSLRSDLVQLIAREAAHLVAISEFNKANLSGLTPAGASAISVVHCGVDLARPGPLTSTGAPATKSASVRLLSVGSLIGKKGHAVLISACQILQQEGVDFKCSIIGAGPQQAQLNEQIASARLADRIDLLGARDHGEVLASYPKHDIFVLASVVDTDGDQDGIPVVLMEAGNAGLPAVSTTLSGIPELVHHGETGLLVRPGDPAALADAIRALALDPDLRARLGRNASAFVKAQFDLQGTAARLEQVWCTTLQQWKENHHAA